jgi:hypothetical protein
MGPYVIIKDDQWFYQPKSAGYTQSLFQAGWFSAKRAQEENKFGKRDRLEAISIWRALRRVRLRVEIRTDWRMRRPQQDKQA